MCAERPDLVRRDALCVSFRLPPVLRYLLTPLYAMDGVALSGPSTTATASVTATTDSLAALSLVPPSGDWPPTPSVKTGGVVGGPDPQIPSPGDGVTPVTRPFDSVARLNPSPVATTVMYERTPGHPCNPARAKGPSPLPAVSHGGGSSSSSSSLGTALWDALLQAGGRGDAQGKGGCGGLFLVRHSEACSVNSNTLEADLVAQLIDAMPDWVAPPGPPPPGAPPGGEAGFGAVISDGVPAFKRVAIITPHRAQKRLITTKLAQNHMGEGGLVSVVNTVDCMQVSHKPHRV